MFSFILKLKCKKPRLKQQLKHVSVFIALGLKIQCALVYRDRINKMENSKKQKSGSSRLHAPLTRVFTAFLTLGASWAGPLHQIKAINSPFYAGGRFPSHTRGNLHSVG